VFALPCVQGEQGQVRCDERPFFVADIGWVRFAVFHGAWILPLWDSSEQALGYAELSIDAVAASAELAARLEVAEGAPLIHLERMTYTRDGQPLELDWIHYRGDRFRYRLRVEREGGAEG
jgi:DNA-binding GntR family transcriptional regulator